MAPARASICSSVSTTASRGLTRGMRTPMQGDFTKYSLSTAALITIEKSWYA